MVGWIKLHRKIMEWEWYTDSNTKSLFLHLLLKANREQKEYQGVTIQRGQLVSGRRKLSIETGLSEQSIRTSLKKLESTSEITIESTNQNSLFTIKNYDFYNNQKIDEEKSTSGSTSQLTINQPADQPQLKKKEEKEYKEEKERKKEGTKKFVPPTHTEAFDYFFEQLKKNGTVEKKYCAQRAQKFIDHYTSNGWKVGGKAPMRDWKAAIRSQWLENKYEKNGKHGKQQSIDAIANRVNLG